MDKIVVPTKSFWTSGGGSFFTFTGHAPAKITNAPLARQARVSAQDHGIIRFRLRGRIIGTLQVGKQCLTLQCSGPCSKVRRFHQR